jgi:hydroxymethylpyrimidine pyrophosphatase-like HAD family hydrolase
VANIAFDVDGCLIDEQDKPRQDVLDILYKHHERGDHIYVWSGGGVGYARDWALRLGIAPYVGGFLRKTKTPGMDIAYDDQDVQLAKVNRRV